MTKEVDAGTDVSGGSVIFTDDALKVALQFSQEDQSIWATVQNMADLFGTSPDNVGIHVKNIFSDGELIESATTEIFSVVRLEGTRHVQRAIKHYNLDAIISVGYRVNAKQAVKFREWATQTLKTYVEQGYVITLSAKAGRAVYPNPRTFATTPWRAA